MLFDILRLVPSASFLVLQSPDLFFDLRRLVLKDACEVLVDDRKSFSLVHILASYFLIYLLLDAGLVIFLGVDVSEG